MPEVKYIYRSGKFWRVTKEFWIDISDGTTIKIPEGFVFDMSSVPRLLWGLFPPFGDFLPAALVHDWMYIEDYRQDELGDYKARLLADREMLYISNRLNKNKFDNYIRYFAVRMFGWVLYRNRKNAKTKRLKWTL